VHTLKAAGARVLLSVVQGTSTPGDPPDSPQRPGAIASVDYLSIQTCVVLHRVDVNAVMSRHSAVRETGTLFAKPICRLSPVFGESSWKNALRKIGVIGVRAVGSARALSRR